MKRKMIAILLALLSCLGLTTTAFAATTAPVAYYGRYSFDYAQYILISLAVGFVIGLIVALILKAQLKSVYRQNRADDYVRPESMHVNLHRDIFLYRNVTRVKRENNNPPPGPPRPGR